MDGMRKYSEFFTIDEFYSPEINPDSIKVHKEDWKKTYPHKDFITFLQAFVTMASRATKLSRHDIWLNGAFGTGKSRFLWTLMRLMDCSDKDFDEYFDRYEALRKETDLRTRFSALRREKILMVFEYSSGEISNIKEFIVKIYDCITRELKSRGMETIAAKTIRGSIADKLEDKLFRPAFEAALKNDEFRSLAGLGNKNVDDIIAQLRDVSHSADALVSSLTRIADRVGFTTFNPSIDFLKEWIEEVIRVNELSNIIFVWDEFSSFFKKLKNELDSLQKLQELHDSAAFNFVIATHEADKFLAENSSALFDRFNQVHVEMPDFVAFELIHDALKIDDLRKNDYLNLTSELADNTYDARKKVCERAKIKEDVMRGILPIHPMAALLLKHISVEFASNQRSMFNFIKANDGDDTKAFQWFINTHSPENGDLLTIDYLWDFFYVTGTDEHSSNTGKANLSKAIVNILDTYTLYEEKLDTDMQRRVLKTVLMMQAISRKTNNSIELLRPTRKNLHFAFSGDEELENGVAENIVENQLVNAKKILYIDVYGKEAEYNTAVNTGDQDKIDEIKERLRNEIKTSKLVETAELLGAFNFSENLKARFDFSVAATIEDITTAVKRIINGDKDHRFRTVICFARNEDEQQRMRKKLDEYAADHSAKDIVFIDVSSVHLGTDTFEQWLDNAARAEHLRKTDPNLSENKAREAKNTLLTWKNKVVEGNFVIRIGAQYKQGCSSMSVLYNDLSDYVLSVYPFTFDNAKVSPGFFTNVQFPNAAKFGIAVKTGGIFQDKFVSALLGEVKGVDKYWERLPDNAISKLKRLVDEKVHTALDTERRISIQIIVDMLIENGFIPCALYAYMTGFLLKEYSGEPYRYSDGAFGDSGGMMNSEKLGEMIGEAFKFVKDKKKYTEKYIEIMTASQQAFIEFVQDVSGLKNLEVVEGAAAKLRSYYKNTIGFPIWCFMTDEYSQYQQYLELISKIMYTDAETSVPALANELGDMFVRNPEAKKAIPQILTVQNGTRAMKEFLGTFENGDLIRYGRLIGNNDIIPDVRRRITADAKSYLWSKSEGEDQLRRLLLDYKIVYQTNKILNCELANINEAYSKWMTFAGSLKMPYKVMTEHCREISEFLGCLYTLKVDRQLPDNKKEGFLCEITEKSEIISSVQDKIKTLYLSQFKVHTQGFTDNEISKLIAQMPFTSFTEDVSDFETQLKRKSEDMKNELERIRLHSLWEKLTDSKSPKDWSEKHSVPIRSVLSEQENEQAEVLWNAFEGYSHDAGVVSKALAYLNTNPKFIERMKDDFELELVFQDKVLEKYKAILYDINDVKKYLKERCSISAYQWDVNPSVKKMIVEYATSKYRTGENRGVMEQIDDMSPDEAKKYLKDLVKNDVEVGISIMLKGGN